MTISTHLAVSNSMSSFVPKYWINWQILVAIFNEFHRQLKMGPLKCTYLSTLGLPGAGVGCSMLCSMAVLQGGCRTLLTSLGLFTALNIYTVA